MNIVHTIPVRCLVLTRGGVPCRKWITHFGDVSAVFTNQGTQADSVGHSLMVVNHPLVFMLPVQITLFDGLLIQLTTWAVALGGVLLTVSSKEKGVPAMLLQLNQGESG